MCADGGMVDAPVLGTGRETCGGSSPLPRTLRFLSSNNNPEPVEVLKRHPMSFQLSRAQQCKTQEQRPTRGRCSFISILLRYL